MRVGDGRPPLGGQPRDRLLRRRAGHELRVEPERDEDHRARTRSSRTSRCTPDGDVWWEGKDGRVRRRAHRLAGPARGRRARPRRRRTRTARFTAPATNNPVLSQVRRTTRRACRSARSSSAAAARRPCRSSCRPSTGRTASSSARRWARRRPPPPPGKVGVVRRDPMAMLPFCGYNMGDYFAALAATCRSSITNPPKIFHGELVPQGQGRQVPLAGLRREHARPQVDRRPRARAASAARRRCSAGCPRPATSISPGLDIPHEKVDEATHIDLDEWKKELTDEGEFFEKLGTSASRRRSSSSASCSSPGSTDSRGPLAMTGVPWWEGFFDGEYLRLWGQVSAPGDEQAAALWRILGLREGCACSMEDAGTAGWPVRSRRWGPASSGWTSPPHSSARRRVSAVTSGLTDFATPTRPPRPPDRRVGLRRRAQPLQLARVRDEADDAAILATLARAVKPGRSGGGRHDAPRRPRCPARTGGRPRAAVARRNPVRRATSVRSGRGQGRDHLVLGRSGWVGAALGAYPCVHHHRAGPAARAVGLHLQMALHPQSGAPFSPAGPSLGGRVLLVTERDPAPDRAGSAGP